MPEQASQASPTSRTIGSGPKESLTTFNEDVHCVLLNHNEYGLLSTGMRSGREERGVGPFHHLEVVCGRPVVTTLVESSNRAE